MYFEEFNKIPYDFPAKIDGSNEFIFVKDITKNVRFRKDFLQSLLLYETYQIIDGETPEIISEKLYGTPYYHWILMLANNKFDYIQDFPLSVNKLDIMVEAKYGDRKHDISYFTDADRNRIQGNQFLSVQDYYIDEEGINLFDKIEIGMIVRKQIKVGTANPGLEDITNSQLFDFTPGIGYAPAVYVSSIYTGFVKDIDVQNKRVNVLIANGGFKELETVQLYKYVVNETGDTIQQYIGEFLINGITESLDVLSVTNYEYEILENEKKRALKVIPKAYLDQIISEYSGLMQI